MKIGILGGGQLAQMLILAGVPLGLEFLVFTPEVTQTTRFLAEHIEAAYDDMAALDAFAAAADVITFETESIPLATIDYLKQKTPVWPDSNAIKNTQDRLLEKKLFLALGIPTNQFIKIDTLDDVKIAADQLGYPFIIKSRCDGYDGKNQIRVMNPSDLKGVVIEMPSIAEAFVDFDREVSLIAARAFSGDVVVYDLCENVHRDGILQTTTVREHDPIQQIAISYMTDVMQHLNYLGVLTIEFFVKDNALIANEMAPRVHNSGHWTIEGAVTSQFENHLRAITAFSLGQAATRSPAVMINLTSEMPSPEKILDIPFAHLHDYRKAPRLKRKLGHVTVVAPDSNRLARSVDSVLAYV